MVKAKRLIPIFPPRQATTLSGALAQYTPLVTKKLLCYTNPPTPAWMMANTATMDAAPVDGVVVILPLSTGGYFHTYNFSQTTIPYSALESSLSSIKAAQSLLTNCVNNIPLLNVRPGVQDWFDDDWNAAIVANFGTIARFCANAGLPGFLFDSEEYQGDVWVLEDLPTYPAYSAAAHEAAVYAVGYAAGAAIKLNYPDCKVFTVTTPINTTLIYNFFNGMLNAMAEGETDDRFDMVFGYESYGAKTAHDFQNIVDYYYALEYFGGVIPDEITSNWYSRRSIFLASAPAGAAATWDHNDFDNNFMTPAVYKTAIEQTLLQAHEYAWTYLNPITLFTVQDGYVNLLDPEYILAIKSARATLEMRVW